MHKIELDITMPPPAGRVIVGGPCHTDQIMPKGDECDTYKSERVVVGRPGHTDQVAVLEDELNTFKSERTHPQGY